MTHTTSRGGVNRLATEYGLPATALSDKSVSPPRSLMRRLSEPEVVVFVRRTVFIILNSERNGECCYLVLLALDFWKVLGWF